MAGCKRCALKGGKRERENKEKRKGKRMKKWGSKSFFFFFFFFLVRAHVFSYAQWSFFKCIRKTVSRLSRLYPLLFAIKFNGESIWRLVRAKYAPPPLFWQLFFKYLWPS